MNRRRLLQTTALAAASSSLRLRAQEAAAQRDRFSGLRAVKFEVSGFFRVEKRERWWFITPEGHGWLGFGVNHVHPGWLNQTCNSAA